MVSASVDPSGNRPRQALMRLTARAPARTITRSLTAGIGEFEVVGFLAYRILTIAPTSFFADYGCHVRIYEEVRTLQDRGHQITLCTYHTGNDVPGMDIRRSLDVPWRKGVQVGSSRHKIYFDAALALTVLRT